MRAIVLAAGRGTRIQSFTEGVPKCLLPIAGENALRRLIRQLSGRREVSEITVVAGYRKDEVIRAALETDPRVSVVQNDRFEEDANVYSLHLALGGPAGHMSPFIVIEADTVFDEACFDVLLAPGSALSTAGPHRAGHAGAVCATDARGRVVDVKLVRGETPPLFGYRVLVGAVRAHAHANRFAELVATARAERMDQNYITAWIPHVAELDFGEVDLSGHRVASFNTAAAYTEAVRIFGR